jgi:hypothetical protein
MALPPIGLHADAAIVVRDGLALGYRMVDADASEGVGHGLRASGVPRSELRIVAHYHAAHCAFGAPGDVRRALHDTLSRLNTSYVDVFLMHLPSSLQGPFGQTSAHRSGCPADAHLGSDSTRRLVAWYDMEQLRAVGLARTIGIGDANVEQLADLLTRAHVLPRFHSGAFDALHCPRFEASFLRTHAIQRIACTRDTEAALPQARHRAHAPSSHPPRISSSRCVIRRIHSSRGLTVIVRGACAAGLYVRDLRVRAADVTLRPPLGVASGRDDQHSHLHAGGAHPHHDTVPRSKVSALARSRNESVSSLLLTWASTTTDAPAPTATAHCMTAIEHVDPAFCAAELVRWPVESLRPRQSSAVPSLCLDLMPACLPPPLPDRALSCSATHVA